MSKFFEETMQGLLEAVAINKGEIPLTRKNMPAPTFFAAEINTVYNSEEKAVVKMDDDRR